MEGRWYRLGAAASAPPPAPPLPRPRTPHPQARARLCEHRSRAVSAKSRARRLRDPNRHLERARPSSFLSRPAPAVSAAPRSSPRLEQAAARRWGRSDCTEPCLSRREALAEAEAEAETAAAERARPGSV